MFTRPALYHPYKRSAPVSPAGFRFADYLNAKRCFNLFQGPDITNIRSPTPRPFSGPVGGGQRHPADDTPPTLRPADLFAADDLGTPKRPSTPGPDHPRNVPPNVRNTNVPAQGPLPDPRRRNGRHGPKHLSFGNGSLRPGLPPRRRAQQLKEKRNMARRRILDHHERFAVQAREDIRDLRRQAEELMRPEHMNRQDEVFLKQLRNLQLDQSMIHGLEDCRQQMLRATNEAPQRKQEHEKRDEEAAKMWEQAQTEEAREEQKRKVEEFVRAKEERAKARRRRMEQAALLADEKRQRAHEAQERKIREEQERLLREELARKAKEDEERRRREEQERRLREEKERQLREERERQLREERERFLREEVERLRREAREQFLREQQERRAREERERQARLLAEQTRRAAQDDQTRQQFVIYEGKWNELRNSNSLPPIDVQEIPWPVFGVVSSTDQITYQDVQTFLFHPLRPGVEEKTARDKVKTEVLRFHPDKFNARVLPKIQPSQRAVAQEIAGAVARILTRIMTEQAEQQK